MICLACAELRAADAGPTCPSCGGMLVPATPEHIDALVQEKLRRRIADWQATRLVDDSTASRLTASLTGMAVASASVSVLSVSVLGDASALEQKADALAERLEQLEDWRPDWGQAFFQALEKAAREEREAPRDAREERDDLGLAADSGQALFQRSDVGTLGDGLDAMVALDDASGGARGDTPKLHEYVWWFLGAVLVLGGSLMGVREAWRALGGVPRQLLVTSALFAYHAGFVGLGVLLARRSSSAGRVLASIGVALLPVVFVALSSLVGLAPVVGGAVSAVAAGLGLLTLRPVGRLLHGASTVSLGVALIPSLLAGLPLMGLDEEPSTRTLCAFAGVVALGGSAWRARSERSSQAGLSVLTTGLYGALFLAVFSVASAPSGFDTLSPGSPLFAGMTLWAVALASVVAGVAMQPSAREAHPQAAPAVETLAHAVVACGALAGALSAFSVTPGELPWVDVASAFTPVAAALAFFMLEPRRRALVHPGVLASALAGVLLARLQLPAEPGGWMVGLAAVGAGLLVVGRMSEQSAVRFWLVGWGVVLSLASLVLTSWVDAAWGTGARWPEVATSVLVAVAAHLTGGYRHRGLHYLGGLAVLVGTFAAIPATEVLAENWTGLAALTLVAALYGVAGLFQETWRSRSGTMSTLRPLDDLSLAVAALGVLYALKGLIVFTDAPLLPFLLSTGTRLGDAGVGCLPIALLSTLLLLRVRRDHSRLVSTLAAGGLALSVVHFCRMSGLFSEVPADRPLLYALVALGFSALTALRGPEPEEPAEAPRGRQLLGWLRLPYPARGRPLYTDGFAVVACLLALLVLSFLTGWMSSPNEDERLRVVLSGVLLTGSAGLAFLSRGFVTWRLRGSVGTLAIAGLLIALTAMLNRAGRPLPPDVAALRLPLIGGGLWLLALGTRRFGPALGRLLEKERHGRVYHLVPHAGVAALGIVLAVQPWLIGGPGLSRALTVVPPLMPLGAGFLALLLAFSFRAAVVAHLGLLLGLQGAALWAVHRTVLGHALVSLEPPNAWWARVELLDAARSLPWLDTGAWLPAGELVSDLWYRVFIGIAAGGLVYASAALVLAVSGASFAFLRPLLASESDNFGPQLLEALHLWSTRAAWLVFLAASFQPGLEAAGLTLASGVLLVASRVRAGRVAAGLGLLLVVHALAHREDTFGAWPGPVLALVSLLLVVLSPRVARWRGLDEGTVRPLAQLGALFYALHAVLYALTTGGRPNPLVALPYLVLQSFDGLGGYWTQSFALPVTLALIAATLLVGACQWKGALARMGAGWGSVWAGVAAVSGLAVWLVADADGLREKLTYEALLSMQGTALALGAAGVAVLAHVANLGVRSGREDIARGLRWGRDAWLLSTGGLIALAAMLMPAPDERALPLAGAAIGLGVAVSLHCAWSERTGRHVYFVQVAVVGVYALVRALYARDLRPEHDALFALALGFVLVGVTVLARRAGIPPVEQATRRFAALLPVGMALVLPSEATGEAALLAGGSGLLYAVLGAVERSRLFGSLAATACNVALLVGALSADLDGIEVYLAPLGLLLLMLGQLFTSSLPRAARNAVRIVGGLLLYVPAAAKLTLQLGQAADGTYAFVFGAACVLGVVTGMALQIRAYLALGTLFLTLDVAATLVHAGLRDHRIGFLVMTLTGLTIVGGRVLATLRRQELELMVRRVRVAIRGWD